MMNLTRQLFKATKSLSGLVKHINTTVNVIDNNGYLELQLENENEKFPFIWLRDNCMCEKCFHRISHSRIIDWSKFNINVKAKSIVKNNNQISITWDDDHKSIYDYNWLKSRSFLKHNQEKYLKNTYRPTKILWDKQDFNDIMHVYDYNEINTNNKQFYNWLMDLSTYGVVLIENAPTDDKEAVKFANKIAFIRKTHYGEDYHIKNKPGTQNVAYLNGNLQLHTDLPYYQYKPGVNLLHCLVQTELNGGDNLLTDAINVAENLRKTNYKVFDILSTTEINWSDIGEEDGVKFYKIHRSPMICLDAYGKVESVRHSIPQRDSHFTVHLQNVKPWYEAFKTFVEMINKHAAHFRTKPGNILAFDNTRLVHGRSQYEDTQTSQRFLVGIFIDWDEVYSKLRVLRNELKL